MKEFVLNYYPQFKCIAGECKHTCCAGWEMYIDSKTLSDYKQKTYIYSALESGVNFKKSKFKADKSGRCAFLNDKNLCEIIINLGEQSLCQVCRDHPRFRSFFEDRVETGLGFSCEKATEIILSFEDKIAPLLVSDNGAEEKLSFVNKCVYEFRQNALSIIQERSIDFNQRLKNLLTLCKVEISNRDFNKIIKLFLSFERLDKGWAKRLKKIKDKPFSLEVDSALYHYAEQFIANGLYRHLYNAEDTVSVRAKTVGVIVSWLIIQNVVESENANFTTVVDVVRAYSSEVEYSQKNLDKLFNFTYKLIKLN